MRSTWLVALYPRRWRERYGAELRALLEDEPPTPSIVLDVVRGALDAHASPFPVGGVPMRSRAATASSLVAFLLVLPALLFLSAAAVRGMQPAVHEPARSAQAIFDAYAGLGPGWFWTVLAAGPFAAALLSLLVIWRRLAWDSAARSDVAAFVAGLRRIARQPGLVLAAVAFVAAAGVLAFAIDHAIAG